MKPRVVFSLFVLAAMFLLAACQKINKTSSAFDQAAHKAEIQKWQSDRLARLTKEDGWLTLVGLVWLKEGENKLGSDPKNAVVLPKDKAPAAAGSLLLEKGHVRLVAPPAA